MSIERTSTVPAADPDVMGRLAPSTDPAAELVGSAIVARREKRQPSA